MSNYLVNLRGSLAQEISPGLVVPQFAHCLPGVAADQDRMTSALRAAGPDEVRPYLVPAFGQSLDGLGRDQE